MSNQSCEFISIQDALDIQNAAFMIPRAMTTIVQEGIEPLLIGERLLQKIQYKPGMTTVFPAIEPLRADEAGDGMDLPQYNINIGGAQSFGIRVKRYGLRLKIAKRFVDETRSPRPAGHNNPRARARRWRDGRRQRLGRFNLPYAQGDGQSPEWLSSDPGSAGGGLFQPVGLFARQRGVFHMNAN
jgi:hypothetical protein